MKSLGLEFNDGCKVLSDGSVKKERGGQWESIHTWLDPGEQMWAFIIVFLLLI